MSQIQKITGYCNWKSKELYADESWIYKLNEDDLHEIDLAFNHLMSLKKELHLISKDDFPLPHLNKKLTDISDYLENNRGIFLLRGMPVERYSEQEMRFIFAGMGAWLGSFLRQSIEGEYIYDVIDRGISIQNGARGTATKDPLPFHTDRCDVVALLCLRASKSGGQSRVVSAVAIHNEILNRDPELLEELYKPYYHSRTKWETGKENSFYPLPVFTQTEGYFATRYLRHFINVAQSIAEVPRITAKQIEAINLLEQIATDPEFCADMEFLPGDVQFLNNFVSLHSRAGYLDHDEQELKRKLLRLWLAVPNSRPLSEAFQPLYQKTGAGEIRGGVPEVVA